jgi:hypothetical protein
MKDIGNALCSENDKGITVGLSALKVLVKKFEVEIEPEHRAPLIDGFSRHSSALGEIINTHLNNPDSLEILLLITEIFYIANHGLICPIFRKQDYMLSSWI